MKQFIEQIYRKNNDYKGIVFLDRDGTINKEVHYLQDENQIEILPGVIDGISILNKNKIAVVVVTNQPIIARGFITIEKLKKINNKIVEILKNKNVFIDAIYSCPHHPEKNHSDIPRFAMKYRIKCKCRKPGLEMYKKALTIYGSKKILGVIGDQERDILAGKNLGTHTVSISTLSKEADFICDNFLDAILKLF